MKTIQFEKTYIVRFIFTILTFILSLVLSYVGLNFILNMPTTGIGALSLVATIPVCIILGIALVSTLIPTIINSCICIGSSSLVIKVLSILILVLTLILTVFVIYKTINVFN